MMKVISVGSQLNNGKDVVCNYLHEVLPGEWYRASLANNVKRIFCETFNVDRSFVEEWKRIDEIPEGFDMRIRDCLTLIGDGFRNVRKTVWLDLLFKDNDKNLLISDCRYICDAEYIRKNNGINILLWRPGHENDMPNKSEQELMPFVNNLKNYPDGPINIEDCPFDLWLKNDGDLDHLYKKIDDIIIPYITEWQNDR